MAVQDGDKIQDYDPLSGTTRRVKRNLLAVSTLALLFHFKVLNVTGKVVGVSGLEIVETHLPTIFESIILYLGLSLWFHWKDDNLNRSFPTNLDAVIQEKIGSVNAKLCAQISDRLKVRLRVHFVDQGIAPFSKLSPEGITRWIAAFSGLIQRVYMSVPDVEDHSMIRREIRKLMRNGSGDKYFSLAKSVPDESYAALLLSFDKLAISARKKIRSIETFSYTEFRSSKVAFELGSAYAPAVLAILALNQ